MAESTQSGVLQYVTSMFDEAYRRVEESSTLSGLLRKVEDRTGIPSPYVVTALTTCFIFFVVLTYGIHVLVDVVIVLYPSYKSFKALQNERPEDIKRWMEYWIVFAFYHVAENILDNILFWLPGYNALKFLFLCWCFAPVRYNGAITIYNGYIEPTFRHNEDTADRLIRVITGAFRRPSDSSERRT